jgi:hypothetical protein
MEEQTQAITHVKGTRLPNDVRAVWNDIIEPVLRMDGGRNDGLADDRRKQVVDLLSWILSPDWHWKNVEELDERIRAAATKVEPKDLVNKVLGANNGILPILELCSDVENERRFYPTSKITVRISGRKVSTAEGVSYAPIVVIESDRPGTDEKGKRTKTTKDYIRLENKPHLTYKRVMQ